jgi:hypothetical protein
MARRLVQKQILQNQAGETACYEDAAVSGSAWPMTRLIAGHR